MADRKMEDILRAISIFLSAIFLSVIFLSLFFRIREPQPFNSTSGKSQSHKRTSLQQTLYSCEGG
jgi:hypothetical protein